MPEKKNYCDKFRRCTALSHELEECKHFKKFIIDHHTTCAKRTLLGHGCTSPSANAESSDEA